MALRNPLTLFIAPAIGAARSAKVLPIAHIRQEQTQWCWAACMEMVTSSAGKAYRQCEMATHAFGLNGCCSLPVPTPCNRPLQIPQISSEWKYWGYSSETRTGAIAPIVLKGELDADRPIECGLMWRGGGGHAVLVVGYIDDPSLGLTVTVNDPWDGIKIVTFDELISAYGQGQQYYYWINIAA